MSILVEFKKPAPESISFIAENMKPTDVAEVFASHRASPLQALESSIRASDYATIGYYKGVPCAAFGLKVTSLLTKTGRPWMLSTDWIFKCKRHLMIQTRLVVNEMLSVCHRLENYVHVDNEPSIRWLKALGFQFKEPLCMGAEKELFMPFYLER